MTRPDKHPHGKKAEVRFWMLWYDRQEIQFIKSRQEQHMAWFDCPMNNVESVIGLQRIEESFERLAAGEFG